MGVYIAEKMAMGKAVVRIITAIDATKLVELLKAESCGITTFKAQGAVGPVKVIFSVIKKQDLEKIREIIQKFNSNTFYTVEDVRHVSEGVFPERASVLTRNNLEMFRPHRKGK